MRKMATQRRCSTCGKLRKMEPGSRYCSKECRAEGRIRDYMDRYGVDAETAAQWIEFDDNLEKPTGWHCVDCGKPSSQYRCRACKRKFLKANGYGDVVEELAQEEALEAAE